MTDSRLDRLEADVRVLTSLVAPLETKLEAHKTEMQNLRERIGALENELADLQKKTEQRGFWLGSQGGLPR
jgi:chromosome segregation ATPase